MLVNNTAPLCWAAFNDRNLYNLFKQTAITLVSKNLTNVAKDVVLPMSKSKKAQLKVNKALQAGSDLEKLVYGNVDAAAALLNPDNLDNLDVCYVFDNVYWIYVFCHVFYVIFYWPVLVLCLYWVRIVLLILMYCYH